MAYGKAKSIPPDQKGVVRLHNAIGKLQQTLVESIPVLIGRLNPGTFGESRQRTHLIPHADDYLKSRNS